jgi:hypothetical protein
MKTILLTLGIALQFWTLVVFARGAEIQPEIYSTELSVVPNQCDTKDPNKFESVDKFHLLSVQAPMCPSGQATCRTFACGGNGIYCCAVCIEKDQA